MPCVFILKAQPTSITCRVHLEWSGQHVMYVSGTFKCYWCCPCSTHMWTTLSWIWGIGCDWAICFDGNDGTWAVIEYLLEYILLLLPPNPIKVAILKIDQDNCIWDDTTFISLQWLHMIIPNNGHIRCRTNKIFWTTLTAPEHEGHQTEYLYGINNIRITHLSEHTLLCPSTLSSQYYYLLFILHLMARQCANESAPATEQGIEEVVIQHTALKNKVRSCLDNSEDCTSCYSSESEGFKVFPLKDKEERSSSCWIGGTVHAIGYWNRWFTGSSIYWWGGRGWHVQWWHITR